MDKEPESEVLPIAASQALARLLSRENRVSDLIAFLAALDFEPFLAVLGLPAQEAHCKREDVLGKRETGSADLVVRGASGPVALLEIKVSAAQHGNQFERYDGWAKDQTPPPACYLIALDGEALSPPPDWAVELTLPRLFRCWQDSDNPHASWLASAAAAVLEGWVTQADGKLGNATGSIVGDLIARRIAAGLVADGDRGTELVAYPTRTFGGAAMVLAYLPFPGQFRKPGAWLCADFRSKVRDRPGAPWELRLGVEVEINDQITAGQARITANDMAMSIRAALTCAAVKQALRHAGQAELAAALSPRHSSRDGLGSPDERMLKEWRANVETELGSRHPLLVHDNIEIRDYSGYRLASLIEVDVSSLDRRQLATLVKTALAHIEEHSSQQEGSRGRLASS
jgi:hypothetical protein